jgi:hypothetical protein
VGTRIFNFCLVLLLLQSNCLMLAKSDVLSASAAKMGGEQAKEEGDSQWYYPTRVSLHFQEETNSSDVTYEISNNGDLRVTANANATGGQQGPSEIMLVKSQWILARNMPMARGYELDALDGFVLTLKMVFELLRAAAPAGPSEITKRMAFDISEKTKSIEVSSISAGGGIEAPWTLRGTIEPTAAGRLAFDLTATTHDQPLHITGTWRKEAVAPVFGDDISIEGWQILRLGVFEEGAGNASTADPGAQATQKPPKTLGELRKFSPRK